MDYVRMVCGFLDLANCFPNLVFRLFLLAVRGLEICIRSMQVGLGGGKFAATVLPRQRVTLLIFRHVMLLPFEDTFRVFIPRSVEGKDFGHAAKIWRHARYQGVSDAVGAGGS